MATQVEDEDRPAAGRQVLEDILSARTEFPLSPSLAPARNPLMISRSPVATESASPRIRPSDGDLRLETGVRELEAAQSAHHYRSGVEMLGRAVERAALDGLLRAAREDVSGAFVLLGEAGIGKTTGS